MLLPTDGASTFSLCSFRRLSEIAVKRQTVIFFEETGLSRLEKKDKKTTATPRRFSTQHLLCFYSWGAQMLIHLLLEKKDTSSELASMFLQSWAVNRKCLHFGLFLNSCCFNIYVYMYIYIHLCFEFVPLDFPTDHFPFFVLWVSSHLEVKHWRWSSWGSKDKHRRRHVFWTKCSWGGGACEDGADPEATWGLNRGSNSYSDAGVRAGRRPLTRSSLKAYMRLMCSEWEINTVLGSQSLQEAALRWLSKAKEVWFGWRPGEGGGGPGSEPIRVGQGAGTAERGHCSYLVWAVFPGFCQ